MFSVELISIAHQLNVKRKPPLEELSSNDLACFGSYPFLQEKLNTISI